jgi:hypothetical protein
MRTLLCTMVVAALCGTGVVAQAAPYEMADLMALDKQGQWDELLAHLTDIPPSKRDAKWEAIAERAVAGHLGAFKIEEKWPEQVLDETERLLKAFPMLRKSKVVMAKRAEVGLQAFKLSYSRYRHSSGDDPWLDKLVEFTKADELTADLPVRAAKVVIGRLIPVCAFRLFKMAFDKTGPTVCKDGDFQKTIVGAFEDGSWSKEATEIANKCWGDLKAPLVAELKANPGDKGHTFRKGACPLFKSKGALAGGDAALCADY